MCLWLTRLADASVVWREPGAARARLIVIEGGEIVLSTDADPDGSPPIPPGYQRPVMARRGLFTVACFDRLRVLTTELKRLVTAGAPVAVRFGIAPALVKARAASCRGTSRPCRYRASAARWSDLVARWVPAVPTRFQRAG
jgi:hypothetical protein